MKTTVYVPSHITGIFNIKEDSNPLKKGSLGIGFLLNKGVITEFKESSSDEVSIKINGQEDKFNETIIKETLRLLEIDSGLEINQKIEVPIGSGFGTSAASALGVAIGTSELLNLSHDLTKSGQIAHLAEINLGSGLGDVIAEMSKGIIQRITPGAPGYGQLIEIPFKDELFVACKTFSSINTNEVISNDYYKNKINEIGKKLLNEFNLNPNLENFLNYSLKFSKDTNLISSEILDLSNELNSHKDILGSSMAMLGNTIFTFSKNKDILDNLEGFTTYQINKEGIKID
ncbi:pantoate kinase [Methanobrevibacter sp. DSM 116169]|uniref:pantoate kinase n=1 Tax=Methanobrevibacter sp. DSM 116169 TaxID=3242727 RepID=UPI0038FD079D